MAEHAPSALCTSAVAKHRVQRGSCDLREPRDLRLRQPLFKRGREECLDGVGFGLRLPTGGGSRSAVSVELLPDFVGHNCIVLDNRSLYSTLRI